MVTFVASSGPSFLSTFAQRRPASALGARQFACRRIATYKMVLERSNKHQFPVGTPAPPFSLVEPLSGSTCSLADVAGSNGTLIAFLSVHCPFVVNLQSTLPELARRLRTDGIEMVAISPNDSVQYPQDGPDGMASLCRSKFKREFKFLYDEDQSVARAYKARCTPDFYLFDKNLKLVYRGRIDGSTPGNSTRPSGDEMLAAANSMLEGRRIDQASVNPSMGCSIKVFSCSFTMPSASLHPPEICRFQVQAMFVAGRAPLRIKSNLLHSGTIVPCHSCSPRL